MSGMGSILIFEKHFNVASADMFKIGFQTSVQYLH